MGLLDEEENKIDFTDDELNLNDKKRVNLFSWQGQFSPEFVYKILNKYTNENDIVFDPFVGSGTVLVESARLGLKCGGNELNYAPYTFSRFYKYCNIHDDERENNTEMKKVFEEIISIIGENKREKLITKMMNLPYSEKEVTVVQGDARNMQDIEDDFCSFVLTSPPYINVLNYHQQYRKEVEELGENVLVTAKNEIGANRKNRGNRFLTIRDYIFEMADVLGEISRICSKGGRVVFVVGRRTTVNGCEVNNSEILYQLCKMLGFEYLTRQERQFKNRFGKIITEDVVHFENTKNFNSDKSMIVEYVISVFKSLENDKNKLMIDEAISRTTV